jgi:hypothetical protein
MDKIYNGHQLIAIRIRDFKNGTRPITSEAGALQMLTLSYSQGKIIKSHLHTPKKRVTNNLQECLVVIKGKIAVDFYNPQAEKRIKSVFVKRGEAILILQGGHGVRIIEDAEIFEFKNGPFIDDKIFIESSK